MLEITEIKCFDSNKFIKNFNESSKYIKVIKRGQDTCLEISIMSHYNDLYTFIMSDFLLKIKFISTSNTTIIVFL